MDYRPNDIYTVATRMPSNSHNALCDEDGYYWPRGLYVQDVSASYRAYNYLPEYEKHAGPSHAYMVMGYEETIIFLPDADAPKYLEPGRYCPRCDMMKSACRCNDKYDEMLIAYDNEHKEK